MTAARVAALGVLAAAVALIVVVLFGGDGGHKYTLLFENGGQLVNGNQVLIAGQPFGKIDDISLTDDGQAEVDVTTDGPLYQGATALIRTSSLSSIAQRYIAITQGPNSADQLPDGSTLAGDTTTSPVDLDQLFNALNERTRNALKNVIQGSATIYTGAGPQANRTYKYFAPALSSGRRLLAEVTRDQPVFERWLVDSSKLVTGLAERRNDLSALTQNANQALGAIASQNQSFDRALVALAPFLRQANTTFVNLRAALGDLDELVNATAPAAKRLPQFLRDLRPVAKRSIPVLGDLAVAVNRDGPNNDLTDSLRDLPLVQKRAAATSQAAVRALNTSQANVALARPYFPDLVAWLTRFGEVTANYDGNGHFARVSPAEANIFTFNDPDNDGTGSLEPIPPSQQFDGVEFGTFERCPGAATQPITGSNPFTDLGNLTPGKCNPDDVPPGFP